MFKKTHTIPYQQKYFMIISDGCCETNFVIDLNTEYQTIEGFGGAVTDAAGINWKNLSSTLQTYLIK